MTLRQPPGAQFWVTSKGLGWSWGAQFWVTPGFWGVCMALGAWLSVSSSSRVPHLGGFGCPIEGVLGAPFQGVLGGWDTQVGVSRWSQDFQFRVGCGCGRGKSCTWPRLLSPFPDTPCTPVWGLGAWSCPEAQEASGELYC